MPAAGLLYASAEGLNLREKLRGGCFRRFSFGCLGFRLFGLLGCASCFYCIKLKRKPPESGGRLCLYEGL